MATADQTFNIIIKATDESGRVFQSVADDLETFGAKAQQVTGPLADIADAVLKTSAAAGALGAVLLGVAINEAGKFENAVGEINTLLDATPQQFDALRTSILEYAQGSTQSIEALNGAIYTAISAGVDYEKSVAFVADSERLAVAGRADLESTTKLLASTLNAYGASTDEATRYSDILFETVRLGQTTVDELASSLAQVTSVAVSAGVPFETVAAAIADLTAKGLPTSQAITGIKAALSNIIKPSKDAQDAAAELGVQFDLNALKTQGLDGLLRTLAEATGGNTAEMARFFGSVEGLNAVLGLAEGGAASFTAKLNAIENSTGATAAAYAKMAETFANVNQNLRNNVEVALIGLGDKLLNTYGDLAKGLGDTFAGLSDAIDAGALDPVLAQLNAFGIDVAAALEDIGRNLPEALGGLDLEPITRGFEAIGEALSNLFGGVDLRTADGLERALQTLVDIGGGFLQVNAGIVEGLTPFLRGLADLGARFGELSPEVQKAGGEILGWGKAIDTVLGFLPAFTGALDALGTGLTALAGASVFKTLAAGAGDVTNLTKALGAAGLAAGGVAFGYIQMSDAIADYNERQRLAEDATEGLIDVERRRADALDAVSRETGLAIDNMAQFNALVEDGTLIYDDQAGAWRKAGEEIAGYREEQLLTADEITRLVGLEGALGIIVGETSETVAKSADALAVKTEAQRKDTQALVEAKQAADEYRLKMEEIASNERIRNIEASVTLNVADIEAQTERVKASFESLNVGIQSTGDLLSTLFSEYTNAGRWEQLEIEGQIERENEFREQQFELQKRLVEQQINYLREKTQSLARGDALIKITADGLEPELEAFLWQILERIQVRASAEGAEFLLGI